MTEKSEAEKQAERDAKDRESGKKYDGGPIPKPSAAAKKELEESKSD
jgi:hypothetical protein